MKVYSKPVTETIDVQSVAYMMDNLAGSPDHGTNQAPKREYIFF